MTVAIKLHQSTEMLTGPIYAATHHVLEATNITKNVFVFKTINDQYVHVATPQNILTYPDSKEEAKAADAEFYRADKLVRKWHSLQWATDDIQLIEKRINALLKEWPLVVNSGIVDRTITMSAE